MLKSIYLIDLLKIEIKILDDLVDELIKNEESTTLQSMVRNSKKTVNALKFAILMVQTAECY